MCGQGGTWVREGGFGHGRCVPNNKPNENPGCLSGACSTFPSSQNSQSQACRVDCNVKYQPICTGAGAATAYLTTPAGGAAVAGGCVVVKAVVCELKCDKEEKMCKD